MTKLDNSEPDVSSKIEELKMRFVSELKPAMLESDHLFLKFLIAKDFKIDQAETMIRKHLVFREEHGIDTILKDPTIPDELVKYCGYSFLGFAKDGSPVYFVAYGNIDLKGIRKAANVEDRFRFLFKITEEEEIVLKQQREKTGEKMMGNIYIHDLTNISFAQATDKNNIEEILMAAKFYKENYPQHIKAVYFVNVSSYFAISFSLVKRFLSSKSLKKLHMYSSPEEWIPVLHKIIDVDTLPAFLGGTRTDPDGNPMCKTFINFGGKIPRILYMNNKGVSFSNFQNAKHIVVPRLSFTEIELDVNEVDSVIEWEFESKSRDIGFGIFLKELDVDNNENHTELLPVLQLDSDEVSEKGLYKCEKVGKYVVLFDNSLSWFKSKEIYYSIKVLNPTDHAKQMQHTDNCA